MTTCWRHIMTTTCSTTYHLSLGNLIDLCSACRKVSDVQEITEQRKDCFRSDVKALVNEDTLLRTHCCPWCFLGCVNWETFVADTKCFWTNSETFFCVPDSKFVSATNVARAGKRGNICVGNNVSATMCPRLPGPLLKEWEWARRLTRGNSRRLNFG